MENTFISVGKSNLMQAREAGITAATEALSNLKNHVPKFALIFATAGYDQAQLLEGINQVIGNIPSSGCSGEGVITSSGSDEGSTAVAIMLFAGDKIRFNSFICTDLGKDSHLVGQKLAEAYDSFYQQNSQLSSKFGTILLFPDALTVNTSELFRALEGSITNKPLILGGTTGDMMQLKKTFQYYNGKVYSDSLTAVFMVGEYEIDWLVSHGCEEIGFDHTVTKADKNIIATIDGEKA